MAEPSSPMPVDAADLAVKQIVMAAERTWLAWWRSALVAIAGALAVGRVTPQLLHVASWPYVLLGVGYGLDRHRHGHRSSGGAAMSDLPALG